MSLVGTRPPTVDEWEKYELHHRSRMSIKPGITGMWQASGRSDITDFEEVVKLDTEYIEKDKASPAMHKYIWKPATWVLVHKFKALFTKHPYSMYELKICRDYRDGKVTKEDLDKMSVKVLRTNDTWYGMTYKEDVAAVKESFSKMLEDGTYKGDLFSDL